MTGAAYFVVCDRRALPNGRQLIHGYIVTIEIDGRLSEVGYYAVNRKHPAMTALRHASALRDKLNAMTQRRWA